jgi:uncharacterized coiled-coil protein SlyX
MSLMLLKLSDFPQIKQAPVDQQIKLIDELWEQVRRARPEIEVHPSHLSTLAQRLKAVQQEPSQVLSPSEARAQLKR